MNSSEFSENEWEQVQSPSAHIVPPSTIQSREWEMVEIRASHLRHDCSSVFPPNHHEGLQINSDDETSPSSISSAPSSPPPPLSPLPEEHPPEPNPRMWVAAEIGKRLRLRFEIFSSVVFRMADNVRCRVGFRGGFRSIASASGIIVVLVLSLLYLKMQRWRRQRWLLQEDSNNRLIPLLRERDEKISQLLLQIAQMNELLSTRRRVPVIRVG